MLIVFSPWGISHNSSVHQSCHWWLGMAQSFCFFHLPLKWLTDGFILWTIVLCLAAFYGNHPAEQPAAICHTKLALLMEWFHHSALGPCCLLGSKPFLFIYKKRRWREESNFHLDIGEMTRRLQDEVSSSKPLCLFPGGYRQIKLNRNHTPKIWIFRMRKRPINHCWVRLTLKDLLIIANTHFEKNQLGDPDKCHRVTN